LELARVQAAAHSILTNYVDDIAAAINRDALVLGKAFALAQTPFLFCLAAKHEATPKSNVAKAKCFRVFFLIPP
jgi:hypothetical protein